MKRVNPFQAIYNICNRGNSQEKMLSLPPFPRYLDIELTNRCNFRCLMCPTGIGSIKRGRGFMSDEIFRKIFDEITPHKTPVRFVRWGEPLLHRKLLLFIAELKRIGCLVHINTNGSLLDEKLIERLLNLGLGSIKFSFQGTDQISYREMRNTDFFDGLVEKVKLMYHRRGDQNLPFIHVSTTITYETPEQVRSFREKIKDFVDLVTVGRTVLEHIEAEQSRLDMAEKLRLRDLKNKESVVKKHVECPEVFDKLSVDWDGMVTACCWDYDHKMVVGDVRNSSLEEIWRSERMNRFRSLLADMRHDEIQLCSTCYDYHSLQIPGLQQTG